MGERRDIWQQLHEHVARLALDGGRAGKIMLALQARVSLPTVEEIGAAELAEAEHDAAFWERMYGTSAKQIENYQGLIKTAEQRMAEERENMKREAENAETAKAKAARLQLSWRLTFAPSAAIHCGNCDDCKRPASQRPTARESPRVGSGVG
jgi:hypothetical protein